MIVTFDGRSDNHSGDRPNRPVKWTGQFLVADSSGNILEAEWEANGAPPMNYNGARKRADQVIEGLKARLFEKHMQPIRKVNYILKSR